LLLRRSTGTKLVYRPELRTMVPTPEQAAPTVSTVTPAPQDVIARHEAMARGYRAHPAGRGVATAAAHCDKLVKDARAELRQQQ
jgi:hypothetical protein